MLHRFFIALFSLALFVTPGIAAIVTGQATCSVPGETTITVPTPDCGVGGPSSGAFATSTVVDSVDSLQITLAVNSNFASLPGVSAYAQLSIQVSMVLATSGPIRSGYFGVIPTGGGYADGISYGTDFAFIGPVIAGCPMSDIPEVCTAGGGTPWVYGAESGAIFPITLGAGGDQVSILFTATMFGSASQLYGDNNANLSANFGFQAFEADGVTPVALSEVLTPEPRSLMPVIFGLAIMAIGRRGIKSPGQ